MRRYIVYNFDKSNQSNNPTDWHGDIEWKEYCIRVIAYEFRESSSDEDCTTTANSDCCECYSDNKEGFYKGVHIEKDCLLLLLTIIM